MIAALASVLKLSWKPTMAADVSALTGKLSALLVQRFKDEAVLAEVNEIEALTSALSGRIWQKIQLLESAPQL